jgi:hypothetical protein
MMGMDQMRSFTGAISFLQGGKRISATEIPRLLSRHRMDERCMGTRSRFYSSEGVYETCTIREKGRELHVSDLVSLYLGLI